MSDALFGRKKRTNYKLIIIDYLPGLGRKGKILFGEGEGKFLFGEGEYHPFPSHTCMYDTLHMKHSN